MLGTKGRVLHDKNTSSSEIFLSPLFPCPNHLIYKMENMQYQPDMNQSLMQIRLDTQDILDKIQAFLRGERVCYVETEAGIRTELKKVGTPKMNPDGVQSIMNWLTSTINAMTVQGNFDENLFYIYIRKFMEDLAYNLILNSNKWGLADHDIELVQASIKTTIVPFFSRLLGNKERESYTQTFVTKEHSVIQQDLGKGGLTK